MLTVFGTSVQQEHAGMVSPANINHDSRRNGKKIMFWTTLDDVIFHIFPVAGKEGVDVVYHRGGVRGGIRVYMGLSA